MYNPLPKQLTIGKSSIHGLGIFAKEDIPKNTYLGITLHILQSGELIRSPLGGFINHQKKSNCICTKLKLTKKSNTTIHLHTKKDIKAGEELTITYNMYDPEIKNINLDKESKYD